jgi:hypothetical protein
MPVTTPYQCLTTSLLLISSLILLSYFFAQFPHAPQGYSVHPSLASLGPETKAKDVYPENYYPGGAYVPLPFGNVRLYPYLSHRLPIIPSWLCVPGPLLVIRPRVWQEGNKSHSRDLSILLSFHDQIVFIHGLSIPSLIWKDVAPALASHGYRVLLYGMCARVFVPVLPTTPNCWQIFTAAATLTLRK